MSANPKKYHLRTEVDGTLVLLKGRTPTEWKTWWRSLAADHELTSAAIAEALNVPQRTVEGWRQGRTVVNTVRPRIHTWLQTLNAD